MSSPEAPAKKQLDRALFKRILGLFRHHKRDVTLTGIAVLVGVLLGLVPPYLIQQIIDHGIVKQDLGIIARDSMIMVVAVLAGAGMTLLYGYWSVVVGQKIMCELRNQLYTHLQSMSLRFFTSTRTGDIQTRLISDVQGVQTVVSNTIVDQISNIAIVVSTLVAMIIMDWRLTLLSVAMVPVVALVGRWVGDYALPISLIAGMASAIPITAWLS